MDTEFDTVCFHQSHRAKKTKTIDTAETMLAFVQVAPPDLSNIDEIEELLASKRVSAFGPNGLSFCVYSSAGGIGLSFFSLPARLACRDRLSWLPLAPAEKFSFQSPPKWTPKDVLSIRLKPCTLSLFVTAIAKSLPLLFASAYEGTPKTLQFFLPIFHARILAWTTNEFSW